MPRRQISFKNNQKENVLLEAVDAAYDKSAFVKQCIAFYLEHKDKTLNKFNEDENNLDDMDWDFD